MPEQVYKYCDSHGLDVLRNLELKVTPPNQFNDPFEFTPRVICSTPRKDVRRLFKDKAELREMFREEKGDGFKGDFRDYKKRFKAILPKLVPLLVERIPEANAHLQSSQLNTLSRILGVLCMSTNPHSIVMWGHYADKHRGIVIGFDYSWNQFHDKKGLRPVEYVRERPIWDTSCVRNSSEAQESSDRSLLSKNEEWSYEGELRQLFMLEGLNRRNLDNGDAGYFLPFPAKAIHSVHLGVRCPPQREKAIRALLKAPELAHVKLFKASLHEEKFALKFE